MITPWLVYTNCFKIKSIIHDNFIINYSSHVRIKLDILHNRCDGHSGGNKRIYNILTRKSLKSCKIDINYISGQFFSISNIFVIKFCQVHLIDSDCSGIITIIVYLKKIHFKDVNSLVTVS